MAETPETPQAPESSFAIRGQYVKDLSFESPYAPQSLLTTTKPAIEVSVDIKAQKLQDDVFEMTLHIATRATAEAKSVFLVDLAYAGIFHITGIPEQHIEQVLLVDCPFMLFPFARRVIADVTRDGGFPPLLIEPIDFHALFLQGRAEPEAAAS